MLTVQGIVTFLPIEYEIKRNSVKEKKEAIENLLGICKGNTLTLDDVKRERLSRQ